MSQGAPQSDYDGTKNPLDPPAYAPPPEMRQGYLERRRAALDGLMESARAGMWKPIVMAANHARGTGAMYGFPAVGEAAEAIVKAPDEQRMEALEAYARAVAEAAV